MRPWHPLRSTSPRHISPCKHSPVQKAVHGTHDGYCAPRLQNAWWELHLGDEMDVINESPRELAKNRNYLAKTEGTNRCLFWRFSHACSLLLVLVESRKLHTREISQHLDLLQRRSVVCGASRSFIHTISSRRLLCYHHMPDLATWILSPGPRITTTFPRESCLRP
ncbi:hypothetical protein BD410DRAFT_282506 [Rickenella mellea]|uniref:Uncharacterized protein n=1 Tax=Rickenella mellea TaxID=50990 RepID=A0A4Y7Q343_9AGAM|nr:hypothetical protein BD410DRAFT_282506 [Rickenella mellea]